MSIFNLKTKDANENKNHTFTKILLCLSVFILSVFTFVACGQEGSKTINVITIEQDSIVLVLGDSEQLNLIIDPASASTAKIFYTSKDTSIATVDQNGVIKGVGVGETIISATAENGGASASINVTVMAEKIKLPAPTNVRFDGEKIVWDRVENNFGYKVTLNGEEYPSTILPTYLKDFEVGKEYVVTVRALGNGKIYEDSDESQEFSFMQYATPSVDINNNVISITPNSSATKFEILLDGQTHTTVYTIDNKTEYILQEDLTQGRHEFRVIALGDNSQNRYNSPMSSIISVNKLYAPQNAQVEDKVLTFDSVPNAQAYNLKIVNIATKVESFVTIQATSGLVSYDLSKQGYVAGQYLVYIQSKGDGKITIDSQFSTEFAIDKLSTPQNLRIEDGRLFWDSVENATGYIVKITFNEQEKLEENIPYSYDVTSKLLEAGEYYIEVCATGNDIVSTNKFVSSNYSQGITITKLSAPTNINIRNNNVVWSTIAESYGYEVLINKDPELKYVINDANYMNFGNTESQSFLAGRYVFQVRALGNESENILSSQYSTEFQFNKLDTIKNIYVEDGDIKWDEILGVMQYNVYINDSTTPITVNKTSYDLSQQMYEVGEYKISIQAIITSNDSVNGEKSTPKTFTKLSTPTNFEIKNGNLVYQMLDSNSYNGFKLIIDGNVKTVINGLVIDFTNYINDDKVSTVQLQAVGDGQNTISSSLSQPINIHKLTSKVNPKIADGFLSWDAVSGADSYLISVVRDGLTQTMQVAGNLPTNVNLLNSDFFSLAGYYKISIKVLADDAIIGNDETAYSVNSSNSSPINTRKLAPVTNLRVFEGKVVWDRVDGVGYYEIIQDGVSRGNCGTENNYTVQGSAGSHEIVVYAKGNNSTVLDGDKSTLPINVTKLPNVFNFKLDKYNIRWDAISNAQSYKVKGFQADNATKEFEKTESSNVSDLSKYNNYQTLYISVMAMGDNHSIVNSDYSANFEVQVLSKPSNLVIKDGILYFDYVMNAGEYEVSIINNDTSNTVSIGAVEGQTTGTFNLAEYLNGKTAGNYQIRMRANDTNAEQKYLTSNYSTTLYCEKLAKPLLSVNTGKIQRTGVNKSVEYKITVQNKLSGENQSFIIDNNTFTFVLDEKYTAGEYIIFAQAIGNGSTTLTSDNSVNLEVEKLRSPIDVYEGYKNLTLTNGLLVWDNIPNATRYEFNIKINGSTQFQPFSVMPSENKGWLPEGESGEYEIYVQTIGDSTKYLNSDLDYYKNLNKLSAPQNFGILEGKIVWDTNIFASSYAINTGDKELNVGHTNTYEMVEEDGYRSGVNYLIKLRSVGDSTKYLSSELTQDYISAMKLDALNLVVEKGIINWRNDYATGYHIVVKSIIGEEVTEVVNEEVDATKLTYILDNLDEGYYIVNIKALGDKGSAVSSPTMMGYLNADYSIDLPVYKMGKPTNLKIVNDFEAQESSEALSYLEWTKNADAISYHLRATSATLEYLNEIVEGNTYNIGDVSLPYGLINVYLYSMGDTKSLNDSTYYCVNSDAEIMDAYKLDSPQNLEVTNGLFHWDAPSVIEGTEDIEVKYVVNYGVTNIGSEELNYMKFIYTDTRNFQTLFEMGDYALQVCAVGDNCIRSEYSYLVDIYRFDLFESGDGSKENPYLIKDFVAYAGTINQETRYAKTQLEYLNYLYDKNFVLCQDVTIENTFGSIGLKDDNSFGKKGYAFEGSLNGLHNGVNHLITLSEGSVYQSAGDFGLICKIGEQGVVENLQFQNFNVSGSYRNIGIVTAENYGTINNVKVISDTDGINSIYSADNLNTYVGGIAGINYGTGKITNSLSKIKITPSNLVTSVYVGGIVGRNEGVIENCQTASIVFQGVAIDRQLYGTIVGGIAGRSIGSQSQIIACVNNANIDAKSAIISSSTTYARVGGIVGDLQYTDGSTVDVAPYVIACYNTGKITCEDNGRQTADNSAKVGGIVGYMAGGTVDSCYNVGDVYTYSTDSPQNINRSNIGSILGWNIDGEKSKVLNTYYLNTLISMPTCTAPAVNQMYSKTADEFKAEALINALNTNGEKYKYNAGGYPKLIWEV